MYKAIIASLVFAVSGLGAAHCETFTLQTYYPSPVGVYNALTVTSTTVLGRNYGNVLLVPPANASGNVGIGTASPAAKLDVNGDANFNGVVVPGRFAADPTDAARKIEGAIYFNTTSKRHRVFQDGAWQGLGGGSAVPFPVADSTPCDASNYGKQALQAGWVPDPATEDPVQNMPGLRWATCQPGLGWQ